MEDGGRCALCDGVPRTCKVASDKRPVAVVSQSADI